MHRGYLPVALGLACLALVAGCSTSSAPVTSSSAPAVTASATGTPTPTGTPTGAAATSLPTSCSAIPVAVIGPYVGGVAFTRAFPAAADSVSCEFANANASSILVLNIGQHGTAASFAAFRRISALGGRTVTSVSRLGSNAFSISRNGSPAGMGVLTSNGVVLAVTARFAFAKDEALIRQLMTLYATG